MNSHEAAGPVSFDFVDPRSEDAIVAMTSYFEELAERFPEGFDPGDTLVADASSFDPPGGAFLLMHSPDADPSRPEQVVIGCGGVHPLDDGRGEIKRMWVHPDHRGAGHGRRLLSALERAAGDLGYEAIRLDTHSALTQAIAMYESSGYRAIPRYNDNPFAKHWFEKQL